MGGNHQRRIPELLREDVREQVKPEDNIIDNIIGNFDHPSWRELLLTALLVIAAAVFSLKKTDWSTQKRVAFPFFILYICAVLGITVFNRLPFDNVKYKLELFWSYKYAGEDVKLFWEIVLNYFMLLPFGVFGSLYFKRRWVVILAGLLFSSAIELTQFFMRRGLFEFDDIIGNTAGVVIGVGIYSLVKRRIHK